MDRKPPIQKLKIGDVLNGTIVKSNGGRRFEVRCSAVPSGWRVELHARRPELITEGAPATFWVAKIAPLQGEVLVHDGDFGRLPISAAMNDRYQVAIRALLGEGELDANRLADAKGMVQQISKQQQAAWLTAWRLLGEPTLGDQKALIASIDALRAARKEAPDTMPELLSGLQERFGDMLREALRRLEAKASVQE